MNDQVIYDETPERKYSYKVISLGIATAIASAIVTSSLLPSTVTASAPAASTATSNVISTPVTTANPAANLTTVNFGSAEGNDD